MVRKLRLTESVRRGACGALMLTLLTTGTMAWAETPFDENLHPGNAPGQAHAVEDVDIHDGWVQHVGHAGDIVAAYFTIENRSETAHLVDNVSSPFCSAIMGYHSDLEVDSMTRLLFQHLTLPPQQVLVFPPGGYHLACRIAPGKIITPGMKIPMTFHLLGSSGKTVEFEVREGKTYPANR